MIDLSNPEYFIKDEHMHANYKAWVERYQRQPGIAVDEHSKAVGGAGFTTRDTPNYHDHLDSRKKELEYATGPDKERLGLLYTAEQAACTMTSHHDQRQTMQQLMAYDRSHRHPITDPSRDLAANPPTMAEKHHWLTRDDRALQPKEQEHLTAKGWDDSQRPNAQQSAELANDQVDKWYIHPTVRPQIEQAHEAIESRQREHQQTMAPEVGQYAMDKTDFHAAVTRRRNGGLER
ncbi:TPA: hypothetical protein ACGW3G_000903 [Stenotrophomonas maltophilia]